MLIMPLAHEEQSSTVLDEYVNPLISVVLSVCKPVVDYIPLPSPD